MIAELEIRSPAEQHSAQTPQPSSGSAWERGSLLFSAEILTAITSFLPFRAALCFSRRRLAVRRVFVFKAITLSATPAAFVTLMLLDLEEEHLLKRLRQ
jgi:hypothetical protein